MQELTKDADKMICMLYKSYLDKRKSNVSKNEAKFFGGANAIQQSFFQDISVEDVNETICELSRAKFVTCQFASNLAYIVVLNDSAIIYMENRFKNNLIEVTDFISKLIP